MSRKNLVCQRVLPACTHICILQVTAAAEDKRSLLETCRLSAPNFLLSDRDARDLINNQVATITGLWGAICDEAELSEVDRGFMWRRQFLNDYAFEGYVDGAPQL